jgi:DNA-binding response OmpR family regulator
MKLFPDGWPDSGPATVLVVTDDPARRDALIRLGEEHGFAVRFSSEGLDPARIAQASDLGLILLDLARSPFSGFEVCWRLRAAGATLPITMLSASPDPVGVALGLEVGADDYIRTPIEPRELAARINARLRYRSSRSPASPVRLIFPGLVVDVARREVLRDGTRVALTPTELDLVVLLAGSPGQVISRAELIERVWGRRDLAARSVDAHVYRLRRKLEPEGSAPIFIQAVQGVGYRFERRGLAERLARAQGVSSPALVTALADAR